MLSIKKILFTTDFSPPSRYAMDYACELASQFSSELHVLHVLQDPIPVYGEPGMMIAVADDLLHKHREGAQRALDQVPPKEHPVAKRTVRVLRVGAPFVEIVRYAKETAIDLIVIGTHGRTGLKHVLLGSVAENVVRKAPCPVLTVRPPKHPFEMP